MSVHYSNQALLWFITHGVFKMVVRKHHLWERSFQQVVERWLMPCCEITSQPLAPQHLLPRASSLQRPCWYGSSSTRDEQQTGSLVSSNTFPPHSKELLLLCDALYKSHSLGEVPPVLFPCTKELVSLKDRSVLLPSTIYRVDLEYSLNFFFPPTSLSYLPLNVFLGFSEPSSRTAETIIFTLREIES